MLTLLLPAVYAVTICPNIVPGLLVSPLIAYIIFRVFDSVMLGIVIVAPVTTVCDSKEQAVPNKNSEPPEPRDSEEEAEI